MRIAICGKLRSGKDTFGSLLTDMYGFEEFKFSSGITKVIDDLFPEGERKRKKRKYYQTIGQSMRSLEQDVWLNYTAKQIDDFLKEAGEHADIVVTDLRQNNEWKWLKEKGFTVIKVEADEDIRIHRAMEAGDLFDMATLRHETEEAVDWIEADITVTNNGSLEQFNSDANRVMLGLFFRDVVRATAEEEHIKEELLGNYEDVFENYDNITIE